MKSWVTVAAGVAAAAALCVGWVVLHREIFYRQDFAAAFLRHVRTSRADLRIDAASVRVRDLGSGGRIACGGPRPGAPSTLATRFDPTLFGERRSDVPAGTTASPSEAYLLTTFCRPRPRVVRSEARVDGDETRVR